MKKTILLLSICFLCVNFVVAQSGGGGVYEFLKLPASAAIAAQGGEMVASDDKDLSTAYTNPALLKKEMDNQFVISGSNLFDGVNYGFAAYSKSFKKQGNVQAGVFYINYGDFIYTDIYGDKNGEKFHAADYNFFAGWSKQLDSMFTIGVNVKTIYSVLEIYKSVGIATDIGASYQSKNKRFGAGLVLKNFGRQIKSYEKNNPEPMPTDIQAGIFYKPEHLPLRLTLTAHHLQKYDLSYLLPPGINTVSNASNDSTFFGKSKTAADVLLRHAVLGLEFRMIKSFSMNAGFNYLRRQELGLSSSMGLMGITLGFGIHLKKYDFNYAYATYHLSGGSNHFSINLKLAEFFKKKKTDNS